MNRSDHQSPPLSPIWGRQIGGGGDGRWEADDSDECRGVENDAVYGGVCKKWWYVGGSDCETTSRCENREHVLFGEEVYREEDDRGGQGEQAGIV